MRPRLLDLFCKAGGAGTGYERAGFEVVGIDIEPQPNYPFRFICANALALVRDRFNGCWHLKGYLGPCLGHFDAIHASPPCHASTTLRHRTGKQYEDLIPETRALLVASGLPYVIENVVGASLLNPVMLCGSSFGLGVGGRQLRRHRLFESNVPIMARSCQHSGEVVGVYGTGGGGQMTRGYKARGVAEARAALGTPWMSLAECAQAIPPAMTEWIGAYLLAEINAKAAA